MNEDVAKPKSQAIEPQQELTIRVRDNGLIARYLDQGDNSAYDKLQNIYRKIVLNYLYKQTGNQDDAFDLYQQVWQQIADKGRLRSFDQSQMFKPWVMKIAERRYQDYCRRKTSRERNLPTFSMDAQKSHEEGHAPFDPACPAPRPDEQVVNGSWARQFMHDVHRCSEQKGIDDASLEIFYQHKVNRISHSEICSAYNLNYGQVNNLISRMGPRLMKCLAGYGYVLVAADSTYLTKTDVEQPLSIAQKLLGAVHHTDDTMSAVCAYLLDHLLAIAADSKIKQAMVSEIETYVAEETGIKAKSTAADVQHKKSGVCVVHALNELRALRSLYSVSDANGWIKPQTRSRIADMGASADYLYRNRILLEAWFAGEITPCKPSKAQLEPANAICIYSDPSGWIYFLEQRKELK